MKPGRIRCRYRSPQEIDELCEMELANAGFLPRVPAPIDIEQFVHARFGSILDYDELPAGILGMTLFQEGMAQKILISLDLGVASDVVSERREKATIAHEVGHVLLHAEEARSVECLCREEDFEADNVIDASAEIQANRAIGALLLPASLVRQVVGPYTYWFKWPHVRRQIRDRLAIELARVFEVNVAVARVRLKQLYHELAQRESQVERQLSFL